MAHPEPLPRGIVTPLVTFLTAEGGPDAAAMRSLVDYQVVNGVHGVLAVGSTGELGNLTDDQRVETIEIVAAAASGRIPVWAGVVGHGTTDAVIAARRAQAAGADALLVLPPMFFDSSDAELERHFSIIAEAVDVPIVAYDVPPRTPRKLPGTVIASLAQKGVLGGVKDSSGDLNAGRLTVELSRDIAGFRPYAGSEITLDAAFLLGFDGIVPGFANVLPRAAVEVFEAHDSDDRAAAAAAQRQYLELFDVLRVALPGAGGPAAAVNALKIGAAHALGLPTPRISEPMVQPTAEFVERVTGIVARLLAVRA